MKQIVIILALLFFSASATFSQARIGNTKSKLVGKTLVINYDILNAQPTHLFKIWVEITTKSGVNISAKSLSGDVGNAVTGGLGKQIVWDIESDKIIVNESFLVKVFGKPNGMVDEKIVNKEIKNSERPVINSTPAVETVNLKYIGTGKAVLMSAVFPGWGLAKTDPGKPYWLLGIAAYGSLAGSYYMNMEAVSNYDSYLLTMEQTERAKLVSQWEKQNKLSKNLGYASAGIWAVNLIWTATLSNRAKKFYISNNQRANWQISPMFSLQKPATGISLRYNF